MESALAVAHGKYSKELIWYDYEHTVLYILAVHDLYKRTWHDVFWNLCIAGLMVKIGYHLASTFKGIGVDLNFHGLASRIQGIMQHQNISMSSHSISLSCFMRGIVSGLNWKGMDFL